MAAAAACRWPSARWFTLGVIFIFASACPIDARTYEGFSSTGDYYRMVEDVAAGKDYYALLELSAEDTSPNAVRKAFRKQSLKWHPDKNSAPEAKEMFESLAFAHDILTDVAKRKVYDRYRKEGLPWHEHYYGRHAHRYGAPDHDIRWVLFWTLSTVTVVHYLYRLHRYHHIMGLVKKTERYRHTKMRLAADKGLMNGQRGSGGGGGKRQKRESKKQAAQAMDDAAEPDVQLYGVAPPGFRDLVVVRLVLLPYRLLCFVYGLFKWLIWYKLLRKKPPKISRKKLAMEKYSISEEEWKTWKRRWAERQGRGGRR